MAIEAGIRTSGQQGSVFLFAGFQAGQVFDAASIIGQDHFIVHVGSGAHQERRLDGAAVARQQAAQRARRTLRCQEHRPLQSLSLAPGLVVGKQG